MGYQQPAEPTIVSGIENPSDVRFPVDDGDTKAHDDIRNVERWLTYGYDNSSEYLPGTIAFSGADRHFLGKATIEDGLSEYVQSMRPTEQKLFQQGINLYVAGLKSASENIINRICRLAVLGSEIGGEIDYRVFYQALEAVYNRNNSLGERARSALFQLAASRLVIDQGAALHHWLQRDINRDRQLEGLVLLTSYDAPSEGASRAILKRLYALERIASEFPDRKNVMTEFGSRLVSYGCDLKLADFSNELLSNRAAEILSIIEPGLPELQRPNPGTNGTVQGVFQKILEDA